MIHKRRKHWIRTNLLHSPAFPGLRIAETDMNPEEIVRLIQGGLPDAEAQVRSDDNTHFEAVVVSPAFAGKTRIARHQMVYGTLGSLMGNEIHAMSIRAHTPEEWQRLGRTDTQGPPRH